MKLFFYLCLLGSIIGCAGATTGSGQTIITGITPEKENTTQSNQTGTPIPVEATSEASGIVGKWIMNSSSAGQNTTNQKLVFSANNHVTWSSTQGSQSGTYSKTAQNFNISFWGNHTYTLSGNSFRLTSTPDTQIWSSWTRQN